MTTPGKILRFAWDNAYLMHLAYLRGTIKNEPDYQLQEKAEAMADEDAAIAVLNNAGARLTIPQ